MPVNIKDVEYVAKLARLEFNEDEKERLADELNNILRLVKKLSEVDTEGVEASVGPYPLYNSLRDDELEKSIDREIVLNNAPDKIDGYFRVPKVID